MNNELATARFSGRALNCFSRLLMGALLWAAGLSSLAALELQSPNGQVSVSFALKDAGGLKGVPIYSIAYQGRTVLTDSQLGLELEGASLSSGFAVANQSRTQADSTWKPVCAERSEIRDRYQQLVVDLRQTQPPARTLRLTFRAYDEGVAFCYALLPEAGLKDFSIVRENTSFAFAGDHTVWAVYAAQGNYDPASSETKKAPPGAGEVRLSQVRPGVERPLTVRLTNDLYAAITEARLVDYARMKLRPATNQAHTLEAFLDAEKGKYGTVAGSAPFTSPWRVVMLANSPGKLLEQNHLILNLNEPCALADTSWIKPGKVLREATLTTAGGKACVEFALQRGLQYIEYDAGWYGFEYDPKSDARDVHLDPKRNPDPTSLNLREVINYANRKGIGVILYVNHLAAEKQLDEILPLYHQWGVKGVKYGFVNVGSQQWTRWVHHAIRKAAENQLMVDIHDEFRSTGYQRTYPNLMTVEGILGNEGFPSPVHNATLPFTRFLTGPGDYTFCWYSAKLKPTHAHQLAISTIFFSPWQFLYWYDRPALYNGDPALDYWKHLPTTWDETRVVIGDIGRAVCVARRQGSEWYVGAIRPVGEAPLTIPLSFLAPEKKYTATIYSDQYPAEPAKKDVKIETRVVDAQTLLPADLPLNGGQAIRIVPQP